MTREELEAAIWHHLTAMTAQQITQGEFVESVLHAADRYATTEVGLLTPAERRRVLYEAGS